MIRRLALLLPLLLATSVAAAQAPIALRPAIAARYPDVRWIDTADLARRLSSREDVVLLDAREPAEFAVSHLAGARRIDPDDPDIATLAIPRRATVVVYCSVGWRSATIADRLARAGYRDVHNLEGGIFQWANEGRDLRRGSARVRAVHPYDETWGRMLDEALRRYRP